MFSFVLYFFCRTFHFFPPFYFRSLCVPYGCFAIRPVGLVRDVQLRGVRRAGGRPGKFLRVGAVAVHPCGVHGRPDRGLFQPRQPDAVLLAKVGSPAKKKKTKHPKRNEKKTKTKTRQILHFSTAQTTQLAVPTVVVYPHSRGLQLEKTLIGRPTDPPIDQQTDQLTKSTTNQ